MMKLRLKLALSLGLFSALIAVTVATAAEPAKPKFDSKRVTIATKGHSVEVDVDRTAEFDAVDLDTSAVNVRIRELMGEGYGHIIVRNPGAKHSLGVGIHNRLKLAFDASRGYFGVAFIA